jgi:hypothetical protein
MHLKERDTDFQRSILSFIISSVIAYIARSDEVYSIKHYVMKFVSDLRQVGGFLLVLWFPPPINMLTTLVYFQMEIRT